jgi:hypothetical protein
MNLKETFVVCVLSYFAVVTPLAGLCHNHEIDGAYHDDCPACRFGVQALGDDPRDSATSLSAAHTHILYRIERCYDVFENSLKDQDFISTTYSRAPPREF